MRVSRRHLLATTAAIALMPRAGTAAISRSLGVRAGTGGGSGGPGAAIATLTLVNESGSTSVSGTPTNSFGWIFKDGDISSGQAPQFQVSGVTQPYSASVALMRSYYPSGALMFAYFSLRPTFTIAAGGSQTVSILNGGTWPSASGRTLTEVRAQSLHASFPAASPSGSNLTGTWGAWLTTANASNLINSGAMAPILDMDGDAGARWRLSYNMSQTEGGAAHGQLVFDFYVHAMNNSAGNLGGFRWSGYARQPWYNLSGEGTTKPAKNWRAFAAPDYVTPTNGVNWAASGVASTPMGFKGSNNSPMVPVNFTVSAGNAAAPTHHYWLGGQTGNGVPCYVTTTGTLPSPLTTTGIFFFVAFGDGSTAPNLQIYSDSRTTSQLTLSGGSGTHTIHPIPLVTQFTRLGFKDDNARYLFFQGGGTGITAETTLRPQIDRTYWQSTGLIPPWDLTLTGTITEGAPNSLWHPHTIGFAVRDQDAQTGDINILGLFPNDAGLDFYNQSLRSERAIRCMGCAPTQLPLDFKDSTTNSVVNLAAGTYTNLPASGATTLKWGTKGGATDSGGLTPPPSAAYGLAFQDVGSTEHQVSYPTWAWIRTGELDFYDFVKELAVFALLAQEGSNRNTDKPVVGRKGLTLGSPNSAKNIQWRQIAWAKRDMAHAALFSPFDPSNPSTVGIDGTLTSKYLIDLSTQDYQQVKDAQTLANNYYGASTAYAVAKGLWQPQNDLGGGKYLTVSPDWEYAFIIMAAANEASRLGSSSVILDFLDTSRLRWLHYKNDYSTNNGSGLYTAFAYYNQMGPEDASNSHVGPSVFGRAQDIAITANYNGGSTSWVSGTTAAFTFVSVNWTNSYTPHNGDIILWAGDYLPIPGGLTADTGYFIVNYSSVTNKFGVSDTFGGAAKTITNTSSNAVFSVVPNVSAPLADWSNRDAPFALGPVAVFQFRAACLFSIAVLTKFGLASAVTSWNTLLADIDFRLANGPGGPYPAGLHTYSYGGLTYPDVRYAYADHFG